MKAFRKSLSILLSMLMVFSLAVVSTGAETTPLEITKQPTVNEPSVEVNAYDVSYQWYAASSEVTNGVLTDYDVRPINNDSPMSEGISSFDNNTGEWTPVSDEYYMEFFWISLSAGDSITLTFSGEVEEVGLGNLETMNAFWGVANDDGSYTVTVDENGEFIAMAYGVDEIVTAVAYGETSVYEPIVAETSATLSSLAVGNKYYCVVTRGDEIVKTDIVVAEYAIVKQPALADPSVEVTFPEDASYQWCVAVKEDVEIGDTTYGVTKTWGTYDSTLGVWTPYVYSEGSDYDVLYICSLDLYVGDTVTVTVDGNVPKDVSFGNNETMSAKFAVLNDDGTYTYTVTSTANYTLFVDAVCEGTTVKITANTYRPEPIEDETSSVLSGFSSGKNYLCQITYKDGTVLYTDHFAVEKAVTKQPTVSSPSVEASFSEEIQSYQWYKKGDTTSQGEIDGVQAYSVGISYVMSLDSVPEYVKYTVINEDSYYDTALGAWIPASIEIFEDESYFGFMVDLEAGETLTVEPLENSVIDSCVLADTKDLNSEGYQGDLNEDGTFSITVEKTSTYILCLYPARRILSLSESSADVSTAFRAYGKTFAYEPVEGETDSVLSSVEYGEEYFCEITYTDETIICSNVLRAIPEIITQPTSEMPLVEVAFEDKVTSYQWYKVEKGVKVVTDDDAYPADYTDEEQGSLAYYDSETQLWHPAYYDDWEETESAVVEGRVYFDNSNSSWDEVYIFCFRFEPEYACETEWPGTKMTNIEGTDIWYYDVPDEYNIVIFNNGADTQSGDLFIGTDFTGEFNCYDFVSGSFSSYEEEIAVRIFEFDLFEVSLKAGETLTIVPDEELYYGEMNIDDGWITSNEDGEYVYYAESDTVVYVYAQDDGDMDITFYATISNCTVLTEVEGANDAFFLPEDAGEYLCVITYEDDIILTSDSVELDPESISITRGDVNGDGIIDMFDYLMVKSYYFEVSAPNALEALRADFNEDGEIDMFDYLEVKSAYFNG